MSSRAPLVLAGILSAAALAFAACGGGGGGAAAPTATRAAPAPTAARAATTAAPAGGDVARGKALIVSQGCAACHTIASVPGAVGAVGPRLDAGPILPGKANEPGIGTRAATRKPPLTEAQYIEESIREPDAFAVPDFQKGLMPKLPVSDAQVKDLVAFLLTLK
ncbi:MAG: cytochrome c [Chloroflexi bacterium]|nr:cytochrome c [Chloroflexota bacterium]